MLYRQIQTLIPPFVNSRSASTKSLNQTFFFLLKFRPFSKIHEKKNEPNEPLNKYFCFVKLNSASVKRETFNSLILKNEDEVGFFSLILKKVTSVNLRKKSLGSACGGGSELTPESESSRNYCADFHTYLMEILEATKLGNALLKAERFKS